MEYKTIQEILIEKIQSLIYCHENHQVKINEVIEFVKSINCQNCSIKRIECNNFLKNTFLNKKTFRLTFCNYFVSKETLQEKTEDKI
jgi:hypothetical protein